MRFLFIIAMGIILLVGFIACQGKGGNEAINMTQSVKPGAEVFLEKYLSLVKGKRVGFVTNPTGVSSDVESLVDVFYTHPDINLKALYGPEHGVRGNAQAGEYIPFYIDKKYGLPVFSLYGQTMKPAAGMLDNIDEYMRSFDTKDTGKIPENAMVDGLDVLLFDIQDVGTRIYTYVATMAFCMQACAESGIAFIVLDRPNPINGVDMEGPMLEYPAYSSFVGLYPVPVRHGMTAGELAQYFNAKFLEKKVDLTVIPMEGWKRSMWYDETQLPWVIPSPNMPYLETAAVYPGQVFIEGTNISEGRGTTRPFELFGAPWIDGHDLTQKLNALRLPGVKFREAGFTPVFSKFRGELCSGAQLHVTERGAFQPLLTTLTIIQVVKETYPENFVFHVNYFDKIMGTKKVREALERGKKAAAIVAGFADEIAAFKQSRKPYLLYE